MGIFERVSTTFRQMSWKEHLAYWVLLLLVSWGITLMYFAGPGWMQNIVAVPYNRELGLLENMENLVLFLIIVFTFLLFRRAKGFTMKAIYLLSFLASIFMLLEEIDYGHHIINYYKGIRPEDDPVIHNIHNKGKNTVKSIMWVSYAFIAVFIIILPYIKKERLPFWIKNLVPSFKLQFTVLTIPLIARLPHILKNMDFVTNGSLYRNLSEFEELAIYYIFLLFFYEMKSRQKIQLSSI